MSYQHAFHAGNFADVVKHACLTLLLGELATGDEPLAVLETHAGAGRYDLAADAAGRTGEAAAGIDVLMQAQAPPPVFSPLIAAVRAANPDGSLAAYPGSPALTARLLRPQDRYVGVEVRDDDHAALRKALMARANATAVHGDGWREVPTRLQRGARTLVLCDPPFERGDDYASAARLLRDGLRVENRAVFAVWTPIKDLETFDAFLREVEAISPPPTLVAEARLRPLTDPMRLNGCAMVVVNDPPGLEAHMREVCAWVAEWLGEDGGEGRVWRMGADRPPA